MVSGFFGNKSINEQHAINGTHLCRGGDFPPKADAPLAQNSHRLPHPTFCGARFWSCHGRDLNSHPLRDRILNPARLPIPPPWLITNTDSTVISPANNHYLTPSYKFCQASRCQYYPQLENCLRVAFCRRKGLTLETLTAVLS